MTDDHLCYKAIDINQKFSLFNEHWSPKIIGSINNYHIKLVKVQGDFTWHKHDETDEAFFVHKGTLRLDFHHGSVEIKEGQLYIVEKGVEHKPYAEVECEVIVFEPVTTINTGEVRDEYTKEHPEWI